MSGYIKSNRYPPWNSRSTQKWMVGRRPFPVGARAQPRKCETVSFSEGRCYNYPVWYSQKHNPTISVEFVLELIPLVVWCLALGHVFLSRLPPWTLHPSCHSAEMVFISKERSARLNPWHLLSWMKPLSICSRVKPWLLPIFATLRIIETSLHRKYFPQNVALGN